ncbi:MAG: FAD-dependent monooxygenase [Myxococcota bacterium]
MKTVCIGAGPASLYAGILLKRQDPSHEVRIYERNAMDDTFGFGVVFSDNTLDKLKTADEPSYRAITSAFAHWDDIDIHVKGQVITSKGHGFAGMARKTLLRILTERARELGVVVEHHREVKTLADAGSADLIIAADGVNSGVRGELGEKLAPTIDWRPNRFVWLGTTFPFRAFTFYFKENSHGLWRVHAYRYNQEHSTFILECTEETWKKSGMDQASEDETLRYAEALFKEELAGHALLKNRSIWRSFPTIRLGRWSHENVVLLGDAVHTAHFSIGSGTKLAMEDAIALVAELGKTGSIRQKLEAYEAARRPIVERLQKSAQISLEWFEETERHYALSPLAFSASLLTRSLRVTHHTLKQGDPELTAAIEKEFATEAYAAAKLPLPETVPPPMFTPLRLRGLWLENRVVVSPMCQYSAVDGVPNDWHLVHLGSRGIGGAGLVISEMTNVSADGRITPGCAGLWNETQAKAWRHITDFVHSHSGAKIGVQLAHAGRKGSMQVPWQGNGPLTKGGWPLLAPSAIPFAPGGQVPREMDGEDMRRIVHDFRHATLRAVDAGFDLIELHAAHGYLLSTFLSPLTNRRKDDYGGSLECRLKFPLEVMEAVRAAWPAERPIIVRISATDWAPGGTTREEAVKIARAFADHGADLIDVSGGGTVLESRPDSSRLYHAQLSERIRAEAKVLTMSVGGISTAGEVNALLASRRADLCALAKQHLADPYWTQHVAEAQGQRPVWPDPYGMIRGWASRHD